MQKLSDGGTLVTAPTGSDCQNGDFKRDAENSPSMLNCDVHPPLSSPPPSTFSPRLQINQCSSFQEGPTGNVFGNPIELQCEVQALTKSLEEMHNLLVVSRSGHDKCKKDLKEFCNRADRMAQHQFSKYKDSLEDMQMYTEKRLEEVKRFYNDKINHLKIENDLLREIMYINDLEKIENNGSINVGDNNFNNSGESRPIEVTQEKEDASVTKMGCRGSNKALLPSTNEDRNVEAMASVNTESQNSSGKNVKSQNKISKFKEMQSNSRRNYSKELYEKWCREKTQLSETKGNQSIDYNKFEASVDHQYIFSKHLLFSLFQLLDAIHLENYTLLDTIDLLNSESLNCKFEICSGVSNLKIGETDLSTEDAKKALTFDQEIIDRLLVTQTYILKALKLKNDQSKIGHIAHKAYACSDEDCSDEFMQTLDAALNELQSIVEKYMSNKDRNDIKMLEANAQIKSLTKNEKSLEDQKISQNFVKKYEDRVAAMLQNLHNDFMEIKKKSLGMMQDLKNLISDGEVKNSNLETKPRRPSVKINEYMQPVKESQVPDEKDEDFYAPYTSAKLNKAGIHFTKISL